MGHHRTHVGRSTHSRIHHTQLRPALPDTLAGEDWVACRRLLDAGCEVLMPWAAPIGTGQGPRNPSGLRELGERAAHVPLIVDAGLGLPSHAPQVMEWGF
jgi:thiazole synthase ThiGH ThiG subunit